MKILIIILLSILSFELIYALPNDANNRIDFIYPKIINYSLIPSVNNSMYLNGSTSNDFWKSAGNQSGLSGYKLGTYEFSTIKNATFDGLMISNGNIFQSSNDYTPVINTINQYLKDGGGTLSLNWNDRYLTDISGIVSLNYGSRKLYNISNIEICSYDKYLNCTRIEAPNLCYKNGTGCNTYNQTYNGLINNISYLTTYNQTYHNFVYNFNTSSLANTHVPYIDSTKKLTGNSNLTYDYTKGKIWVGGIGTSYSVDNRYITNVNYGISNIMNSRNPDLSNYLWLDEYDELMYALQNGFTSAYSVTPDFIVGDYNDVFEDNFDYLQYNSGKVMPNLTIEINGTITNKANGYYQLGLTFRSTTPTANPGNITLFLWNGTAYNLSFSEKYTSGSGYDFFVSKRFVSQQADFNIDRMKIQLNFTSPLPNNFRLQRIIIYHATADRFPDRIHKSGDKMFGQLLFNVSSNTIPLVIYGNHSTNVSLWVDKNISATGFITRTSIYDKSKGSALDKINDASYYINNNKINHSKFYGQISYLIDDFSKPIYKNKILNTQEGDITTPVLIGYEKKIEEGVELGSEIDLLRQAIYELKIKNTELENRIKLLEENIK